MDDRGFIPGKESFSLHHNGHNDPGVNVTSSSVDTEVLSPKVKQPGCEAENSHSAFEVKNAWSYSYTSLNFYVAGRLFKHQGQFYLYHYNELPAVIFNYES